MNNGYIDFISYVNKKGLGLILANESLKKYTTLKIGGNCFAVYKPNSIKSLIQAYKYILFNKLNYH